jgi:hypothetical protein
MREREVGVMLVDTSDIKEEPMTLSLRRSITAATVLMTALLAAAAPANATATATSRFVYVTPAANTSGDSSYLNNGATNNAPGALLFVTPNWDPGELCNCVFNDAPLGVRYDTTAHQWAAFREDGTTMPSGEAYNVLAVPPNKIGAAAFVHTATIDNIGFNETYINSPKLNGKPRARFQVTQNLTAGGVLNPHNIGVFYSPGVGEWAIYNEDQAAMPEGATFNVLVGDTPSNGGFATAVRANKSNTDIDHVEIDNVRTNGNPNNITFATHVFNLNGISFGYATFNDAQVGVYMDSTTDREYVFNEDGSLPRLRTGFNLLIFSG